MKKHLLLLLFLGACSVPESPPLITVGFYHWKAQSDLQETHFELLQLPEMGPLHLRLFDIDWDAQGAGPIPVGILQTSTLTRLPPLEVVPTFFLTNRTFLRLKSAGIPELVQNMLTKSDELLEDLPQAQVSNWQIDCDWTAQTRSIFFEFCRQLREQLQRRSVGLSATIRLHQVKYRQETGVPPVDRGTLMVYNTGKLAEETTINSILTLEDVRPYLENWETYPLDLDIALPTYAWALVFRDQQFIRILNPLPLALEQDSSRFRRVNDSWVEVKRSTFLNGYYLYQGDRIRLERISEQQLLEVAALLAEKIPPADRQLLFYHLDEQNIASYSPRFWLKVREIFQEH